MFSLKETSGADPDHLNASLIRLTVLFSFSGLLPESYCSDNKKTELYLTTTYTNDVGASVVFLYHLRSSCSEFQEGNIINPNTVSHGNRSDPDPYIRGLSRIRILKNYRCGSEWVRIHATERSTATVRTNEETQDSAVPCMVPDNHTESCSLLGNASCRAMTGIDTMF